MARRNVTSESSVWKDGRWAFGAAREREEDEEEVEREPVEV